MSRGKSRRAVRGNRRDLENRERLLLEFDRQREDGFLADEAAKKVAVPLSSLYRWARERPARSRQAASFVDAALGRLATIEVGDRYSAAEALFQFHSWLRWPTDPSAQQLGTVACLISYLYRVEGHRELSELPGAAAAVLSRTLNLSVLRDITSEGFVGIPFFELIPFDRQKTQS